MFFSWSRTKKQTNNKITKKRKEPALWFYSSAVCIYADVINNFDEGNIPYIRLFLYCMNLHALIACDFAAVTATFSLCGIITDVSDYPIVGFCLFAWLNPGGDSSFLDKQWRLDREHDRTHLLSHPFSRAAPFWKGFCLWQCCITLCELWLEQFEPIYSTFLSMVNIPGSFLLNVFFIDLGNKQSLILLFTSFSAFPPSKLFFHNLTRFFEASFQTAAS